MRPNIKDTAGFSLIELVISLGILAIVGTMIGQSTLFSQQKAQQIDTQSKSYDDLKLIMQRIRKDISIRDASAATTTGPTSLTLSIPTGSASRMNFVRTVETRCRVLPGSGRKSIDTTGVPQPMKACLDSFGCKENEVPYVQWLRDGVESEQQPNQTTLDWDASKKYALAGYGLCFSENAGILHTTGLVVNLEFAEKSGRWRYFTAVVKMESLSVPIRKRNDVDVVPQ